MAPLLDYGDDFSADRNDVDDNDWMHVYEPLIAIQELLNGNLDGENIADYAFATEDTRCDGLHKDGFVRVLIPVGGTNIAAGCLVDLTSMTDPLAGGGAVVSAPFKAYTSEAGSVCRPAVAYAFETLTAGNYGTVARVYEGTSLDTSGSFIGAPVWLSATPGAWTLTVPAAPNRTQLVGRVLSVSATAGKILFTLPGTWIPWTLADQV